MQLMADHNSRRVLIILMLVALAARVAVIPFVMADTLDPKREFWSFGCEEGRIGRALASGEGFSSPLPARTGPTAWSAPVYPVLIAITFKLFGIFSLASAWVLLVLSALFGALTCIPVYFLAHRISERAGFWAACVWALHPYSISVSNALIWGYCLDALLLSLLLCYTIRLEEESSLLKWSGYGILWGFASLDSPAVLAVLPFLIGWLAWRRQRSGRAWRFSTVVAMLLLVFTVSPWFVRNYVTFGRFIPFRDNFWLVFWQSNTGDLSNIYAKWANPPDNPAELAKFVRLGEIGYMQEKRALALERLRQHPGEFLHATFKRVVYTWTGYWSLDSAHRKAMSEPMEIPNIGFCTLLTALMLAGIRRAWHLRWEAAAPLALVLLTFPVLFYITHLSFDYRHPIDPVASVFIGVLFAGWHSADSAAFSGKCIR